MCDGYLLIQFNLFVCVDMSLMLYIIQRDLQQGNKKVYIIKIKKISICNLILIMMPCGEKSSLLMEENGKNMVCTTPISETRF